MSDTAGIDVLGFSCPCGRGFEIPVYHAGAKFRCPECNQKLRAPVPPGHTPAEPEEIRNRARTFEELLASAPAAAPAAGPAPASDVPEAVDSSPQIIRFECACGRSLKLSPDHAGRKIRCPECGQKIRVPTPTGAPAPAQTVDPAERDRTRRYRSLSPRSQATPAPRVADQAPPAATPPGPTMEPIQAVPQGKTSSPPAATPSGKISAPPAPTPSGRLAGEAPPPSTASGRLPHLGAGANLDRPTISPGGRLVVNPFASAEALPKGAAGAFGSDIIHRSGYLSRGDPGLGKGPGDAKEIAEAKLRAATRKPDTGGVMTGPARRALKTGLAAASGGVFVAVVGTIATLSPESMRGPMLVATGVLAVAAVACGALAGLFALLALAGKAEGAQMKLAPAAAGGVLGLVPLGLVAFALTVPAVTTLFFPDSVPNPAGFAADALAEVRKAQEDWKVTDADGNSREDFWTRDVAGLHFLRNADGVLANRLREEIALADELGLKHYPGAPAARAYHGYRFCVLTRNGEGKRYQADADGDRVLATNDEAYAVCAYPESYREGTLTLLMCEDGAVWAKDRGVNSTVGVFDWPKDPARAGWARWSSTTAAR